MNFRPQNRYLLVQTQAQEDADNTGVLLPEGYSLPKDKYVMAYRMLKNDEDIEQLLDMYEKVAKVPY